MGKSQWTSVPAGAGPLQTRCHIKPPLPGHSCGTILVQTTSCQLSWDIIKTVLWVPHIKDSLIAFREKVCVYKIQIGEGEKPCCT